jgi:hypothetical protein
MVQQEKKIGVRQDLHFQRPISATARDLISYEIYAIHFIGVARQVGLEFISLQIPDLFPWVNPKQKQMKGSGVKSKNRGEP